MLKDSRYKVLLALLPFLLTVTSCGTKQTASEKIAETPAGKAHHEVPLTALQESSPPGDVIVVLMGNYEDELGLGYYGKFWIRAKATNNTKYTFSFPWMEVMPKSSNAEENSPEAVILHMSRDVMLPDWKPGESILLTCESGDTDTDTDTDNYYGFQQWLTKILKLPANEPVDITEKVAFKWHPNPEDCFNPDCPYKKLPKDDPDHCGK